MIALKSIILGMQVLRPGLGLHIAEVISVFGTVLGLFLLIVGLVFLTVVGALF